MHKIRLFPYYNIRLFPYYYFQTDNPKLEQFQELLDKNASVFYSARTAKSLQNHWQMMKQYQLLSDQIVNISDQPLSFSDAEDLILGEYV